MNVSLEINGQSKCSNKTIFCHDNMETTAAIPSTIINQKYNSTGTLEINSIKELINESQSTMPVKMSEKFDCSNKTIYCNNGMEITAAISRDVQFSQPVNIWQDQEIPTNENKISDEILTQSQNQNERRLSILGNLPFIAFCFFFIFMIDFKKCI